MSSSFEFFTSDRIAALHRIRDRYRGQGTPIQRVRLLEAIETLGHCTTFEASRYLDIYDPRARKLDLVKRGHEVITTWRYVETESGEKHRIGVYSLRRG